MIIFLNNSVWLFLLLSQFFGFCFGFLLLCFLFLLFLVPFGLSLHPTPFISFFFSLLLFSCLLSSMFKQLFLPNVAVVPAPKSYCLIRLTGPPVKVGHTIEKAYKHPESLMVSYLQFSDTVCVSK